MQSHICLTRFWIFLSLVVVAASACKHADATKQVGNEIAPVAALPLPAESSAATAPARQPELPPSVDAKDLDPAERKVLLEVLAEQFDPCGKTRSFLDALRAGDCAIAPRLAAKLVEFLGPQGLGKKQAVAALLKEIERVNTVVAIDVKGAPLKGAPESKVTIVEFSDFECPFCRRAVGPLDKLRAHYNVALYYKFYPLRHSHPNAEGAARAAWAAHQQGKFWPMHDLLFANQHDLEWASVLKYAAKAGLDAKKFEADVRSDASKIAVQADEKAGEAAQVDGTPTFFVNGRKGETLHQVEEMVREALATAGEKVPGAMSADDLSDADALPTDKAADAKPAADAPPAATAPAQ